jgi:hypothetical protein
VLAVNREFQINPSRADQFVDTALHLESDGADRPAAQLEIFNG